MKLMNMKLPFTDSQHEGMKKIRWLPIIDMSNHGDFFGITETGMWAVTSSEGLKPVDNQDRFIGVICILEHPFDVIEKQLKNFTCDKDMCLTEYFPFVETVKYGLELEREHWTNLALDWYESFDEKQKIQLNNLLPKLLKSKSLSQNTRHRVKKILKEVNFGNIEYFRK